MCFIRVGAHDLRNGYTALHFAAQSGSDSCVRALIKGRYIRWIFGYRFFLESSFTK